MSTLGQDGNMRILRTSFCPGTMTNYTYPHSYQHAPNMPPAPLTAMLISSLINLDCTTATRAPELMLCVCVDPCEGKCTGNAVTTFWSVHTTAECTKKGEGVLLVCLIFDSGDRTPQPTSTNTELKKHETVGSKKPLCFQALFGDF